MDTNKALYTYLLRLADDSLIMGQRLSEWCSKGPFLEEDLALTNIALDYIGRAEALLNYAATIDGRNQTADTLAYLRPEHEYLNHLLCETPNGDFAHTMARQLYHSAYEFFLYKELSLSKNSTLAGIAAKAYKETAYHLQHAANWVIRLGDGTEISKQKMQNALQNLWMYTGELFEIDEVEKALVSEGIATDNQQIKPLWEQRIKTALSEAGLIWPTNEYMQNGGRNGRHTEYLGHLLCEMQYLPRTYPQAVW